MTVLESLAENLACSLANDEPLNEPWVEQGGVYLAGSPGSQRARSGPRHECGGRTLYHHYRVSEARQ